MSHLLVEKPKTKSNSSILNFFKKSESALATPNTMDVEDESLFLANNLTSNIIHQSLTSPNDRHSIESLPENEFGKFEDKEPLRYNEEASPNKRRRVEISQVASPLCTEKVVDDAIRKGPFIEDSDDDDEISNGLLGGMFDDDLKSNDPSCEPPKSNATPKEKAESGERFITSLVPQLEQESTSVYEENDFQGIDDFIDDEFPEEGEEYLERKWMEEQRQFELGLEEDGELEAPSEIYDDRMEGKEIRQENGSVTCPICSVGFDGLTEQVRWFQNR